MGLVHRVDREIFAENAASPDIVDERIDGAQRVRRNEGAAPLDHVAVVVVVRGLDQDDLEGVCHAGGSVRRHCSRGSAVAVVGDVNGDEVPDGRAIAAVRPPFCEETRANPSRGSWGLNPAGRMMDAVPGRTRRAPGKIGSPGTLEPMQGVP